MEQSLLQILAGNPQDIRIIRDAAGAPMLATGQPINKAFARALEIAAKQSASIVVEQKSTNAQDVILEELFGVKPINHSTGTEESRLIQGIMPLQQPPALHVPTQESFVAHVGFVPDVAERLDMLAGENITVIADTQTALVPVHDVQDYNVSVYDIPDHDIVAVSQAVLNKPVLEGIVPDEALLADELSEQGMIFSEDVQQDIVDEQIQIAAETLAQNEKDVILATVIDAPVLVQQNTPIQPSIAAPAVSSVTLRDSVSKPATTEVSKPPYRSITHVTEPLLFNTAQKDSLSLQNDATLKNDVFATIQTASLQVSDVVQTDGLLQPLQDMTQFMLQEGGVKSGYSQPVRFVVPTPEMYTMPAQQQVAIHMGQALADGQRHINIRLHPEELGRVDIRMDISKDQIVLHVITETQDAYNIFKASKDELARLLQESGFDAQTHHFEFSHQQQEQQQQGNAATTKALELQSEIISENNKELVMDAQTGILLATQGLNIKV